MSSSALSSAATTTTTTTTTTSTTTTTISSINKAPYYYGELIKKESNNNNNNLNQQSTKQSKYRGCHPQLTIINNNNNTFGQQNIIVHNNENFSTTNGSSGSESGYGYGRTTLSTIIPSSTRSVTNSSSPNDLKTTTIITAVRSTDNDNDNNDDDSITTNTAINNNLNNSNQTNIVSIINNNLPFITNNNNNNVDNPTTGKQSLSLLQLRPPLSSSSSSSLAEQQQQVSNITPTATTTSTFNTQQQQQRHSSLAYPNVQSTSGGGGGCDDDDDDDDGDERIIVVATTTSASLTSALSSSSTIAKTTTTTLLSSSSPVIESSSSPLNNHHHQQQQNIPYHHLYNYHQQNHSSSSSSSPYGITEGLKRFQKNPYNNTIGSFANPLLLLDVDIRNGTESLPRAFQPPYSTTNNKKSSTLKQSIYQRSLSIFTNGVSPLLRKKKSKSNQQQRRFPNLDYQFVDNNYRQNHHHQLQQQQLHNTLSTSTLGLSQLRRKSEPIMFSYDSITNELSKFQAREEKIVKNINLDFEKMLMNDTNGEYCTGSTSSSNNATGIGGNHFIDQSSSLRRLAQQQQQFGGNVKDDFDHYGKTMISAAGQHQLQQHHPHSASTHQFIQQQTPSHHQQQQQQQPQLSYKEPFYMVYEDNRNKQLQQQQQHHHSNSIPTTTTTNHHHHQTHHNDDNIYEEIDFLTLSSLRAQYADTLSLQSYKKKGGSKRSLASSSFTRWFSTRKKNSPSMSEDENPYIDIKLSKKQRPPITLPEIPGELSKEQLKRRYIIGSIVDSENSYINSLQRIINLYKKPLEESSPSILSQNKINIIFHRLEQILQCHTIFGIALSQCVREWDEKEQIGDVFIASFSKSMVLDIYSDFINNFTNAMETARKAAKSKSAFAQFLQEKSLSSPDRLSFFGLMVKPVQRFPQFILLLSDLLKHTPSDHHDRMSLQLALTQLESLADRLNERKRDAERHFAVKQLLKDYLSSSTTNSSNRFLLRQDDIYQLELDTSSGLVMKTKCRKLYLLNDMLVCVSVPANRLKYAVSLQDVDVMDDVTPATNNLIANSMLKSKDPASATSSPKHCTVERMYCDLNSLIHDLEVISRVSNLLSSLRYQYQGISVELVEQIGTEIREEIRKKDAQITLIDRSCLQIRIRSKNYKDIICIQMNDPETKKDWLTDVRLAKLALDRSNNPAWDIVNETISTTRTNLSNSIIMHRVPLFVKSLPIFATTEHSMLTCALHYRINRRDDLVLENNAGVLWICNVNENGSQLGALATNGTDISLIHSYELCDSHVTCIESVGSYAVWIGLRQGRIIVIDASSPGEWQQFAALDVSAEVTCIRYFGNFVYVGLITGVVALFNATHYEEPIIISLSTTHPVTCLLPVNKEMFACCGEKIWIINNAQLDRSYYLHNNNKNSPTNEQLSPGDSAINVQHFPDEDLKPNLLAHCGIGLWVSLVNSSIIKLYHTETFKHLQDVNVASNVKRILNEMIDPNGIFVTAMLATRGLLWIGTNVGVIVTLNLPRLQGVPLISGCLNVALHRHTGPVTILLNLTNTQSEIPVHPNNSTMDKTKSMEEIEKEKMMMMMKNEDVESIYGLYSDLMNVENYVRVGHDHRHDIGNVTNSGHHMAVSKMTWDLANINLSDDSTSESAIYQDGLILRKKPTSTANLMNLNKRRTLGSGGMTSASSQREISNIGNYPISSVQPNNQLSPAKSQNSIYDSSIGGGGGGGNDKSLIEKENISSSSGIGASSSLYDIAPFKSGQKISATSTIDQPCSSSSSSNKYSNHPLVSSTNQQQQQTVIRHYDNTIGSSLNNNKTALLMTGGNGYKRVSLNEATYSSQHAHCCIWEYKL